LIPLFQKGDNGKVEINLSPLPAHLLRQPADTAGNPAGRLGEARPNGVAGRRGLYGDWCKRKEIPLNPPFMFKGDNMNKEGDSSPLAKGELKGD